MGPFRISGRTIDPALNRVATPSGETVQVEPKIMQVLAALAERPGEVVTRDDLMARVWNGVFVTDDVLHRAIREIRRLFDDDAEAPRVIETIRKRGYRLIAPVEPATAGVRVGGQSSGSEFGDSVGGQTPVSGASGRHLIAAAVVLLAAIAAVARFALTQHTDRAIAQAPRVRFMPMTSDPGNEVDPALSASGKLAYVARGDDGRAHLFTKPTPDAPGTQVTRGDGSDHAPVWSPDETALAFVRMDATGCHILTAAADGRAPRAIAPCASRNEFAMSWSPDGRQLAITAGDGRLSSPSHIELLTIADGARRAVTQPPPGHAGDLSPAFSPDGQSIAFVRVISGGITSLCVGSVESGRVTEITRDGSDVLGVDWDPSGTHLIYSSDRAGAISVWRILARRNDAAPGPQPELLAGGGSKLKHPSVAQRTGTVAYEEWQYEINLRDYPTETDEAPDAATSISATSDRWNFHPQISPDGTRVVFQSTRSGQYEFWLTDRAGRDARPITRSGVYKSMARWSPDGRRLVFTARAEVDGAIRTSVIVLDVDSGVERVIVETTGALGFVAPSWALDGASVYVGGNSRGEGFEISNVNVESGERRTVVEGGFAAVESSDGRWLYFARLDRPGLWRQPVDGGTAMLVAERVLADQWPNWGVTDRGVYFVGYPDDGDPQLFTIDNGSTTPRPLTRLPEFAWPGVALSRDGSRVIYAHADRRSSNIGGLSFR